MSVFLTGGTGYIGSAVLRRLIAEEHDVIALVRTPDKAGEVTAAGAQALIGNIADTEIMTAAAAGSEGVIHLASPGDETSADVDAAVVSAVLRGLGTSRRPFVYTGGVWTYGSNPDINEDSPPNSPALTAWRPPIEKRVLEADGVRGSVVIPAVVYGHSRGLPRLIVDAPRTDGDAPALHLIGDGSQHWLTVHVEDLAALYVLVFELGAGGSRYLGLSGGNPTVRELGAAAADAAGLNSRVQPETLEETRERLGRDFADVLLLDQQGTGTRARIEVGWEPNRASLVDELRSGSYRS